MLRPGQLYFAYGCNMDADLLRRILGVDLAAGWAARLPGWRVAFDLRDADGSAVANLIPGEGCTTFGVVYRLPRDCLPALDRFEDHPTRYRHETVWVEPLRSRARQAALVYVGEEKWQGEEARPAPQYLEHIVSGAVEHLLPPPYVAWLKERACGRGAECFRE